VAVSREIEEYVVGQLKVAGEVASRRMFGGVGLYIDGVFCAIIGADSGRLYLKVDDSNRSDYEAAEMEPFRTPKGVMAYYTVPEPVLENAELLRTWALKARAVGARAKPTRKRKRR
jgi:DNA transformation protein